MGTGELLGKLDEIQGEETPIRFMLTGNRGEGTFMAWVQTPTLPFYFSLRFTKCCYTSLVHYSPSHLVSRYLQAFFSRWPDNFSVITYTHSWRESRFRWVVSSYTSKIQLHFTPYKMRWELWSWISMPTLCHKNERTRHSLPYSQPT